MLHEKISEAFEPRDLTSPVRHSMAEIIAGLDARFMQVGTTLAEAVETIDRIVRALDEVGQAFEEGEAAAAVGNLTLVAHRLNAVPDQQAVRQSKIVTIRSISTRIGNAVADARNTLDVLTIYSFNVKIAAAGAPDFVDFADQMQRLLAAGKEQIKGFEDKFDELEQSLSGMEKSDRLLTTECDKVVPEVPERLVNDAAELRARQGKLADLAIEVQEIARAIQANVAVVLGAIQIGDITRQRLEHIQKGFQLLNNSLTQPGGNQDALRHHMLSLFAAQLYDTAAAFGRETASLVRSLRGIVPDAKRLLAFGDGDDSLSDSRRSLRRLEMGIGEADSVTRQLREADKQADGIAHLIADTVDDLTARAENVSQLRLDVQLMSINIGLRSGRVDRIGRPVAVVANEVRNYSDKLDGMAGSIVRGASELGVVSEALRTGDDDTQINTGVALAQSLAAIGKGAMRTEKAMEAAGAETGEIADMIMKSSEQLELSLSLENTMKSLGDTLAALAGPKEESSGDSDHHVRNLMSEFRKCYTMAQERDVHEQFLLPGQHERTHGAKEAISSDDDLFDEALF